MFEELLISVALGLQRHTLPYMIIGGQAVLLYGTPRMTKDIDITLGVSVDQLERVLRAVHEMGLEIIPEDFRSFVARTFVLPTKERKSGIRVDFIFSFTPYERNAIENRSKPVLLRETVIHFASVEDVVIHKIFASRPRDLEDVKSMLVKNPDIDMHYITSWLRDFEASTGRTDFVRIFQEILSGVKG